ncbi:hypothetical protein K3555_22495 (plasmid) [Leisingera sp. M527]|uniref:hypothetical protein n=1 Tax=Leisingera sp. M527 TaxID=2867014 RepID=UPI0021A44620|nr:hypothetical protein [Leisingera sp. M527]UWQ35434.1 hypothetical protein K3555_22495 [Leisingera sp. M527]
MRLLSPVVIFPKTDCKNPIAWTAMKSFLPVIPSLAMIALTLFAPAAAAQQQDTRKWNSAALMQTFAANYKASAEVAEAVWPGLVLKDLPKVVVVHDTSKQVIAVMTVDHPNPAGVGTVQQTNLEYADIRLISDPDPAIAPDLIDPFRFVLPVAGVPTFVIASECGGEFLFCASDPEFVHYFIHEAFHRFQIDHFADIEDGELTQYDYSAEHLYSILIENAVLSHISDTLDDESLHQLAQELVDIRHYRAQRFEITTLDDQQERIEGTAKFLEDRLPGAFPQEIKSYLNGPYRQGEIKSEFGFGRFYGSGAIAMDLSLRLGTDDVHERIREGAFPMQLLTETIPPDLSDPAARFQTLAQKYDTDSTLRLASLRYADWAATEPDWE